MIGDDDGNPGLVFRYYRCLPFDRRDAARLYGQFLLHAGDYQVIRADTEMVVDAGAADFDFKGYPAFAGHGRRFYVDGFSRAEVEVIGFSGQEGSRQGGLRGGGGDGRRGCC